MDGTNFPERSDSSQKQSCCIHVYTKTFYTGDSPMNLSFTYAKYFYSNFYYGCPTASATGSTGEDEAAQSLMG